jgi:hypothetical protein
MLTIWGESQEYPVVVSYDADNAAPWSCTVTTPSGDMATASGGSIETAMAALAVSVSELDSFVSEKGAKRLDIDDDSPRPSGPAVLMGGLS